jgi:hypothetical protein
MTLSEAEKKQIYESITKEKITLRGKTQIARADIEINKADEEDCVKLGIKLGTWEYISSNLKAETREKLELARQQNKHNKSITLEKHPSFKEVLTKIIKLDKSYEKDKAACEKFGIKVGWFENPLKSDTLQALEKAREKERKRKALVKKRKEDEKKRIEAEKEAKRNRILSMIKRYEHEVEGIVIDCFNKNQVCIGMPVEMVDHILGTQYEKKESVSAKKTTLKCKYGRGEKNQRGNYTYKLQAVFENGFLKSYKQL